MNVPKKVRLELNALSKDVFGTSSHWEGLVNQGYKKPVMKEEVQVIPPAKEGDVPTEEKIQVQEEKIQVQDVRNGFALYTIERYTVEGIRTYMLERKEQLDLFRVEIKRQQDEAKAKKEKEELAAKVHKELAGSAI